MYSIIGCTIKDIRPITQSELDNLSLIWPLNTPVNTIIELDDGTLILSACDDDGRKWGSTWVCSKTHGAYFLAEMQEDKQMRKR